MPRVHTRTARASKYDRRCSACSQPIEIGQQVYTWKRRYGGPQYRHVACGYPRPSQLSSRKTAVIEDAIQDAQATIGDFTVALSDLAPEAGWTDETEVEIDYEFLAEALGNVASEANSVADEYESGAENMPESLQYGEQAEAMRDVAERLREWASDLENWTPDDTTVYLPEREETENWEEDAEQAVSDLVDTMRTSAEDALSDMPELEM